MKNKKPTSTTNFIEAPNSFTHEFFQETTKTFANQIFGEFPKKHYSGELVVGEQILVEDIISGKFEDQKKLKRQIFFEKTLLSEEKALVEKKSKDLNLRLHAITQEMRLLAEATPKLTKELQIAAFQSVVNPGEYHLIFFEKMLEFIRSFRKRIDDTSIWLASANKRAQKKTYWTIYKKHGGKFLLSSEHYLQRSAG